MVGLDQSSSSYIILSSNKLDAIESVLYGRDYTIVPIKEYYLGQYNNSIISYGRVDNNNLRQDILFILNRFDEKFAIIKYNGETSPRKILQDGSESQLDLIAYNTDFNNPSYLYNGYSFSFLEKKKYFFPTKKADIKLGMIVEFFNNNKWVEKRVSNPDTEYENLYKLLIKYNKIRIPC